MQIFRFVDLSMRMFTIFVGGNKKGHKVSVIFQPCSIMAYFRWNICNIEKNNGSKRPLDKMTYRYRECSHYPQKYLYKFFFAENGLRCNFHIIHTKSVEFLLKLLNLYLFYIKFGRKKRQHIRKILKEQQSSSDMQNNTNFPTFSASRYTHNTSETRGFSLRFSAARSLRKIV